MLEAIRQILETTLFPDQDEPGYVCLSGLESENSQERHNVGEFKISNELFPGFCKIQELASGESFLSQIQEFIIHNQPKRLFLFPPFMGSQRLPSSLRQEFPQWDLAEITLYKSIEVLQPGSCLGVVMPEVLGLSRRNLDFRKYLFKQANIAYLISADNSYSLFGGFHSPIRFNILILELGKSNQIPIKFFRLPSSQDQVQPVELTKDFQRLAKQGGGKTNFGYVHKEKLDPEEGISFDKHHPDLLQRQEEMEEYGLVKKLSDICEIRQGTIHKIHDAGKLTEGDASEGIPLIEARDILTDGNLNIENTRYKVIDAGDKYLRPGDICLRTLNNPGATLTFSEITSDLPRVAASNNVVILRLSPDISLEDRELILAYLGSNFAAEWLRAQGMSLNLHIALLKELPVPLFDNDLRNAFRSLNEAANQFEEWKKVAEQARNSLFKFSNAQDSRLYLLTTGREARQRQEAAKLIDDFDYRARTRLPHPIAYRWRTVKSSYPDLEGYMGVLECAEVAICYLAHMAIVLAQHLDIPINHLKQDMAERLSEKQHGTNFGDWVTILRQVRDSKHFRTLTGHIPFYEVLKFLDLQADEALKQLSKRRNDLAHNRGPKGAQVSQYYNEALKALEILLKSVEFASEYPLRYIEDTKRDSIKKVTNYSYRDLMGDHPLVPIKTAQTTDPELEASSLYLVDRDGKLYLLRPLLSRRQCPECGTWATFYLDSYKKSGDTVLLKSMEHGHSALDPSVAPIFRDWGVLKETF